MHMLVAPLRVFASMPPTRPIDRSSIRQFELAYGPFPIPVTVTDEDRRFVWVNSACCRYYGKPPSEILGNTAACLVEPDALAPQKTAIVEFNRSLENEGCSVRRFTNHAQGKEVRVLVVAFLRRIGRRQFRVGVAIPEHLTSYTPCIADLVVRGRIDLEGFYLRLRKRPKQHQLMQELCIGLALKEAHAFGSERGNRKAMTRILQMARVFCDEDGRRNLSLASLKNLSALLADRLLGF